MAYNEIVDLATGQVTGILPIVIGGTNASSMATSSGIVKYDGTRLVTSSTATIDSSNRQVNTAQPAFMAYLNTSVLDVTGDGTQYTVIYDTEVFDQGSNFNLATSVFTAPVTGRYAISVSGALIGGTSMTTILCRIVTSNRTYRITLPLNAGITTAASAVASVLADMDAADTFTITLQANDSGGKIDDAAGTTGGDIRNWVSATLSC